MAHGKAKLMPKQTDTHRILVILRAIGLCLPALLLVTCLAGAEQPAISPTAFTTSTFSYTPKPVTVTLRFPDDRSMGELEISRNGNDWIKCGEAKGAVVVPAKALLSLSVEREGASDLSPLKNLAGTRLTRLIISGKSVQDESLRHLAGLTSLRDLQFHGTSITGTGLQHLARMHRLNLLCITDAPIQDKRMTNLPPLISVRHLNLTSTPIGDEGLKYIVRLTGLTGLGLGRTQISDPGVSMLKDMRLRELYLTQTAVTDECLRALGRMPSLQSIHLEKTGITDAGLPHLATLGALHELFLSNTKITNEGLRTVGRHSALYSLGLDGTTVTTAGLRHLTGLNLRSPLYPPPPGISEKDAEEFRRVSQEIREKQERPLKKIVGEKGLQHFNAASKEEGEKILQAMADSPDPAAAFRQLISPGILIYPNCLAQSLFTFQGKKATLPWLARFYLENSCTDAHWMEYLWDNMRNQMAYAFLEAGKADVLNATTDAFLNANPNNPRAIGLSAYVKHYLKHECQIPDQQIDNLFQRALQRSERWFDKIPVLLWYADFLKDKKRSAAMYEEALSHNPRFEIASHLLDLLSEQGRTDRMDALWPLAGPCISELYQGADDWVFGNAYLKAGDRKKAVWHFCRALELDFTYLDPGNRAVDMTETIAKFYMDNSKQTEARNAVIRLIINRQRNTSSAETPQLKADLDNLKQKFQNIVDVSDVAFEAIRRIVDMECAQERAAWQAIEKRAKGNDASNQLR
jgi:hypothetical protein